MPLLVFGSLNLDLVLTAPQLPRPGETLTGTDLRLVPGGKGANQAVACARLGAVTHMLGRVGADDFGATLRAALQNEQVQAQGVLTDSALPSGVALITVDARGENTIVVVPGANGAVGAAELMQLNQALPHAQSLLLQLEVPLAAVLEAAHLAKQQGVRVILDPAPARPLPTELFPLIDVLTPNETEAAALVGFAVPEAEAAARAAQALLARGVPIVIIKRGARGVTVGTAQGIVHYAAFPVRAIDTVAAGDAFNGGLAVALAEGRPLPEAVRWGLAAGALAVTRAGAQAAMPTRAELLALLAEKTAP